jgi:hypothetical protein
MSQLSCENTGTGTKATEMAKSFEPVPGILLYFQKIPDLVPDPTLNTGIFL